MSYSGKYIVRSFQNVPESLQTYHGVGYRALDCTFKYRGKPLRLGGFGHGIISVAVSLEFIGSTAMAIIFVWRNASSLLPQYDLFWIAVVSSFAMLPTCWYVCVTPICLLKVIESLRLWFMFDCFRLLNVSELGILVH